MSDKLILCPIQSDYEPDSEEEWERYCERRRQRDEQRLLSRLSWRNDLALVSDTQNFCFIKWLHSIHSMYVLQHVEANKCAGCTLEPAAYNSDRMCAACEQNCKLENWSVCKQQNSIQC